MASLVLHAALLAALTLPGWAPTLSAPPPRASSPAISAWLYAERAAEQRNDAPPGAPTDRGSWAPAPVGAKAGSADRPKPKQKKPLDAETAPSDPAPAVHAAADEPLDADQVEWPDFNEMGPGKFSALFVFGADGVVASLDITSSSFGADRQEALKALSMKSRSRRAGRLALEFIVEPGEDREGAAPGPDG